jgi:hypothetical protein
MATSSISPLKNSLQHVLPMWKFAADALLAPGVSERLSTPLR